MAKIKQLKITFPWGAQLTCTAVQESENGGYTPVISVGMPTHSSTIPLTREAAESLKDWLTRYLGEAAPECTHPIDRGVDIWREDGKCTTWCKECGATNDEDQGWSLPKRTRLVTGKSRKKAKS